MAETAVVVVSYNTRDVLRACLRSVTREAPAEIVVADNGSTDGSIEMVRDEYPEVILDVESRNAGYGAAANRAIRRCRASAVLLLNSDTVLAAGSLSSLRAYMEAHPRAGIVAPRLVSTDGSLQPTCHLFPSPLITLLEYSWLGDLVGLLPRARDRYLPASTHDRARVVDWVTGAALLIRRKAFEEVGGFDERFFMYFEDVDLGYRLRKLGWETHFAPVAEVTHVGGASTSLRFMDMYSQEFASLLRFYQLHMPTRVRRARAAIRAAMLTKLGGYSLALLSARGSRRALIRRNLSAWWRVFITPAASQPASVDDSSGRRSS